MEFKVDEKIVEPIIKAHIEAAILSAVGDPSVLIQRAVAQVMAQKVNSSGVRSNSDYENKHDFIEVMCGTVIRAAAKSALEKIVANSAPQIEAEIARQLSAAPKKTAAAIMNGFMGLAGQPNNYRLKAEFVFTPNE